jgi:Domain of unknown function (DUF4091)
MTHVLITRKRAGIFLFLMVIMVACLPFESTPEPAFTGPKSWLVSGMDRIAVNQWQDIVPITTIYAAKGEYEPFQLVIRAPQGGLSNASVSVSEFQDASGQGLAVTLYREHFVYADDVARDYLDESNYRSSNLPESAGWYPDALIPFVDPATLQPLEGEVRAQPFNVDARRNQIIWADVFVPRDAPAGTYASRYTISTQEGEVTGEVSLVVWDFVLPLKPSLTSSFLVWKDRKKETYLELLKHKLMPDSVPAEFQAELMTQWGLSAVRLRFSSGADYANCTMKPSPSVEEFRQQATEQNQDLLIYVYASDEVSNCKNLDDDLKQWARNTRAAGAKNLIVMTPRPSLYDDGTGQTAADIWVVQADQMMDPTTSKYLQDVQTLGNEIWSYTALAWNPKAPKWAINFGSMNHRILPGFINQLYGMTGLLYWRVEDWSNDPWNRIKRSDALPNYPSGEGMLLYPGDKVGLTGAVASIRLKWLREGVEDYEYIQILKSLGRESIANDIVRSVAQDWYRWNKDPRVLEQARQRLAQAILESQ